MQSGTVASSLLEMDPPEPPSEKPNQSFHFVAVHPNVRNRWLGPTTAVRSNAARHQWKEIKAFKPRGRRTKIHPDLSGKANRDAGEDCTIDHVEPLRCSKTLPKNSRKQQREHNVAADVEPVLQYALPYDPFPTTLPRKIVAPLFDFICWFSPQVSGWSRSSEVYFDHLRWVLSHPGGFHSAIYAAGHLQDTVLSYTMLRSKLCRNIFDTCRLIAIQNANNLLSNVTSAHYTTRLDDIVYLIGITNALGSRFEDDDIWADLSQPPGPQQAPLKHLDALDRWGIKQRFHNIHITAAVRLIEVAGGIDTVPEFQRMTNSTYVSQCALPSSAHLFYWTDWT